MALMKPLQLKLSSAAEAMATPACTEDIKLTSNLMTCTRASPHGNHPEDPYIMHARMPMMKQIGVRF